MRQTKLIVLRGPSGAGKSTIAKALFANAKHKVVLIEQDYYRYIFKPVGGGSKPNVSTIHKMMKNNVLLALKDGYDVILEGILNVRSYSKVLNEVFAAHTGENYLFYFDISFEETLRRHQMRHGSDAFTLDEKLVWYKRARRSNHTLEKIIPEHFSIEQTVSFIREIAKL